MDSRKTRGADAPRDTTMYGTTTQKIQETVGTSSKAAQTTSDEKSGPEDVSQFHRFPPANVHADVAVQLLEEECGSLLGKGRQDMPAFLG
ncbi:hypothetical protein FZEAL_67 [Fusarium zealandicum]|uniref:Uncharacterized protein n=1 Tax=Fusarium zealandicum TaxID=1053134 RepID=A0A8H4UVI1_9HYPO|nr:hypothetical protein FZEAL_67 [Fusarium zealandicum]